MREVSWKFFCDSKSEKATRNVLKRIKEKLQVEVFGEIIKPYHKKGHYILFKTTSQEDSWKHFVFETIEIAQRVGYAWDLSGSVLDSLDGWSHRGQVSGAYAIGWNIFKEEARLKQVPLPGEEDGHE